MLFRSNAAAVHKNKKEVLRWTHHIKTTIGVLHINGAIKNMLDNIAEAAENENWILINEELNILFDAETIIIKEIDIVLSKKNEMVL